MNMCVCVCVRARVRALVRVRMCVYACVWVYTKYLLGVVCKHIIRCTRKQDVLTSHGISYIGSELARTRKK